MISSKTTLPNGKKICWNFLMVDFNIIYNFGHDPNFNMATGDINTILLAKLHQCSFIQKLLEYPNLWGEFFCLYRIYINYRLFHFILLIFIFYCYLLIFRTKAIVVNICPIAAEEFGQHAQYPIFVSMSNTLTWHIRPILPKLSPCPVPNIR